MQENFSELFNEVFSNQPIYPGALIDAQIIRIDKDYVILDAGLKSEGWVPLEQFFDKAGELEATVGDQVKVEIKALEDGFGETRLSYEGAKRLLAWSTLQEAFDNQAIVQGTVIDKVKGGFTVDMGVLQGFLPGSLVDSRAMREPHSIENQQLDFKLIKLDPKRNNIVLSRRAVLESEDQTRRESILAQLTEGQTVKGVVKNLTNYGAFIDIGLDGLLHNSDIAWRRIRHASEVLHPGEKIEVVILKIDRERGRVSLGLKQLLGDPWVDIDQRYPIGTRLMGTVTNITGYGIFIQIEPGVEGLVHISAMEWTNRNANPNKIAQLGLEMEVMVLDIDIERRRISLGLKQCQANPWEDFANQYTKGDVIQGKIRSITDLGLFIGLEGGIDGLVHHTEIADNLPNEEIARQFKKGDEINTIILSIDPERERVALSIRQLPKGQIAHSSEQPLS
jgi:small subunit ribosomal protein S1